MSVILYTTPLYYSNKIIGCFNRGKNMCFNGVKGTPYQIFFVFKTDIFLDNLTTKIFVFELFQDNCKLEPVLFWD